MVNSDAYAESAPNWHGTIIVIGISVLAVAINVFGAKWLPYWQNAVFIVHILAYVGFIIPIWLNAPRASHSQVWGAWEDRGGWSSIGLSVMVGQLPALSSQTAIDSVCVSSLAQVSIGMLRQQRPFTWRKKSATRLRLFRVS